ncbi:PLC-like phosphodiesterase [Apodospora peruviana]|uniref:Phosphoinositide phospholipase C n=1 Tax=Apodospora peruviana TaxID=516989 RepID=A0AAE0ITR4_9PEZI|nr:PLC-like phosphodiesterase [Apodospora peruviana]
MMCFKFKIEREERKKKPNFFRRKTTFRWGTPNDPKSAWLAPMLIGALAVNANKEWVMCNESVRQQVERVYDTLRGSHEKLSRDIFLSFMTTIQGIAAPEPLHHKHYSLQEFHYVWSRNEAAWRAVRKLRADENDLSHPISNYFISSSHNTYLEGNQLASKSSADAYRAVLKGGCRCIEIDVWNGTPSRSTSKSPHPEHRRHLSSTSIVETLESVKQAISDRTGRHSRTPSTSQPALPPSQAPSTTLDSSTTLDPLDQKDLTERLEQQEQQSRDSSKTQNRTEPIVYHHGTMTSTVPFREVCKAIAESAFETNPLPLIVSLEVGADREQQEIMVEIMKEEWEGLLLDEPFDHFDHHQRQPLLDELTKKILIKVKRLDDSTVDPEAAERGRTLQINPVNAKPPICDMLAKLAIYTHSEHFEDQKSLSSRTPSHIFSLSEDRFTSLVQAKKDSICNQLFLHNRNFFMRIYPKGLRVDSSNPDPSFHWRRGVQMVAMNWQKSDEGMMINDGMFADTNGWVLKPPGFLSKDEFNFDNVPRRTINLRITILAAQYLPPPEERKTASGVGFGNNKHFRPHVKVELHVEKPHSHQHGSSGSNGCNGKHSPQPMKAIEYVQETPAAEGSNPDWGKNGVEVKFMEVSNVLEQLSFVRFKVEDTSNTNFRDALSCWACIRLDRLQQGYRWVDLYHPITRRPTHQGQLFVRIDKTIR